MAALSDYLESGLLSHVFRNTAFTRPTNISIALTAGVPKDSDNGSTIPELPSGTLNGLVLVDTNYRRVSLGDPATNGNLSWEQVGVDNSTAFSIFGSKNGGGSGYFYPLYLNQATAQAEDTQSLFSAFVFSDYPTVMFYGPKNIVQSGVSTKSNFADYEGNGFIKNKNQILFNRALTEWGWVSGIAVVDSSGVGQGNLLMHSKLANPRYVYVGDTIRFDPNSLEISLK
jgi:hypothetical protein